MSELCITVTGRTAEEIRRARQIAEAEADLVELRLDSMARPDPEAALADRRRPAIVTCRPAREGGGFDGAEDERLRVLARAQALGAEFVDVEADADLRPFVDATRGRGVIASMHDFSGTPSSLSETLARLHATGAEIVKLAVMTRSLSDLRRLCACASRDRDSVLLGMGDAGVATRVLAARIGSRWTYAGNAIAPGQLPPDRLLHEYRFRRIRADAAVYALLGTPVAHSLSPAMHNAGFAALGLNAVYVPVDVDDLSNFRPFAEAMGVRGASVTIPLKRRALDTPDALAPLARAAGAVNTLILRDGRWIGANTDSEGFLAPLRHRMPDLRDRRAVILGAGGAARGVAFALTRQGARVAVAARRPERAHMLAADLGIDVASWPPEPRSWDILVNATPVGSTGAPGLPVDVTLDGSLVYDLVYEPDRTPLMARAIDAGLEAIGGLEMLVAQAERQFELWTGECPPAGLFMEAAAQARAERRRQHEADHV
jgi:3-dehydroquinate dehydratase/shikimate dehydrogenase